MLVPDIDETVSNEGGDEVLNELDEGLVCCALGAGEERIARSAKRPEK